VSVNGVNAGVWLEPLGNPSHRWLDDLFQIPTALSAKHRLLTIQLVPLSGGPAWNAAQYEALSHVSPFIDDRAPSKVPGLVAQGNTTTSVTLTWGRARDNVGVTRYEVHGSQTPSFTLGPQTLLGETTGTGFLHKDGIAETWYYRVRAVDGASNTGDPSDQASGTTGSVLEIEAESLLPAVEQTAPAVHQGNCCGLSWSGGAQLWFQAGQPSAHVTLAFAVPKAGQYDLSAIVTRAGDYGVFTVAVDGQVVGQPYDAYKATLDTQQVGYGPRQLGAGQHTLTITVTGKHPASAGYLVGVDKLELALLH
jgi:hypothetical protein